MTDINIPEEAYDRAWNEVASVRDASPRRPDDADTGEVVAAALGAAAPLIVAADRSRMLPQLEFLFEHADDFDVPGALRLILAGTWDFESVKASEARRAALRASWCFTCLTHHQDPQLDQCPSVLRGEGQE